MVTATSAVQKPLTQTRLQSIDIVRGAIMILMALDHIRDFFHQASQAFAPEDLARTNSALFFTRWITHYCAPVFMFYAGVAAFLWAQRGKTGGELSSFLWRRGLWLIVLELTIVRSFGWYFNLDFHDLKLIVLWALGCSMIALAALVRLPMRALVALSLGMIALHNLLDGIRASQFGSFAWAWSVLHQPAQFQVGDSLILIGYPLIPWIGVMAAGYCFGRVFQLEPARRQFVLVRLGIALTAAFVVVRAINVYGDAAHWSVQKSAMFTVISFLNCTKYPPSLDYLLMTLGPAIAVTGWIDRVRLSDANPLLVFGRVPLFYYVLHLPLIHGTAMLMAWIRYGSATFFFNAPPAMGTPPQAFPAGYGYDLWVCYAVWIVLIALLYPACLWYARLKQRRRDWWLSYL